MASSQRVDIDALARDFDERMAALNADRKLEDARMECLEAIEMLRRARKAAELSEGYVRNSMALMADEFRDSRGTFEDAFHKDFKELKKIKADFEREATPLVEDVAQLRREILRANADLEALRGASKKFAANADDMKHLLRKKYATQTEFNEYFDKLKGLEKMSEELLKGSPANMSLVNKAITNVPRYYGTTEGSVVIPEAFHAVRDLNKELGEVCNILGTDGFEALHHFRTLTAELNDTLVEQTNIVSRHPNCESAVVAPSESASLPDSTSQLRIPFIDEISTILLQRSSSAEEVTSSDSNYSYSDFDLTANSSDYLTSVES
ncbi:hypothetical protein QR680_012410 [Steinernema hermaphroditum]|uniref:Uncharacterized protein n=1 Tax=Steinernema hermaphroditum TaxID=289476 RepID=A0AA39M0G6_9BILA|nr:hypothetical protein QR680_012410 [Steinernema hermaphroditum]